jgi:hypothetical protein
MRTIPQMSFIRMDIQIPCQNSTPVGKVAIPIILYTIVICKRYIKDKNSPVKAYICIFIQRGTINFLTRKDLYSN